jgi:hypothetical protein
MCDLAKLLCPISQRNWHVLGTLSSSVLICLVVTDAIAGNEMKPAPLLDLSMNSVTRIGPEDDLEQKLEHVGDGATVLIADGAYRVRSHIDLRDKHNVTICSASRNPSKVVISGIGWSSENDQDDILRIGKCTNITVAHITFRDCHSYAIKVEAENYPENIRIYNCRFRDIGTRCIKGSGGHGQAKGGSIRFCDFENTRIPPANWLFDGNYIAAIDMMALDGWVISDNVFKNIKGRTGSGRAAVFIWVRSRNVTVERNLILHCDRGVAFGNPSASTSQVAAGEFHVQHGVCRNNFILPGPDAGIELWWVDDVQVYHNSVWRKDTQGRGIRIGTRNRDVHVANNLIRGALIDEQNEQGSGNVIDGNIVGGLVGFFRQPENGRLSLTGNAAAAIDTGSKLPGIVDDFFGRPRDQRPDMGAAEFRSAP